jgi:hypothetical protein
VTLKIKFAEIITRKPIRFFGGSEPWRSCAYRPAGERHTPSESGAPPGSVLVLLARQERHGGASGFQDLNQTKFVARPGPTRWRGVRRIATIRCLKTIAFELPTTGTSALAVLLEQARKRTMRVWAELVAF